MMMTREEKVCIIEVLDAGIDFSEQARKLSDLIDTKDMTIMETQLDLCKAAINYHLKVDELLKMLGE